jgi:nucleotide-binding universal stress UspA family protein
MGAGPILVGYDGSPRSDHAISEAGVLLSGRPALVVVVYEQGTGFEMIELPTAAMGVPPAEIDVRTALEVDRAMAERAQRLARHGAELAGAAGFAEVDALAVADDVDRSVAETLVTVAGERDAAAIVVGAHGHGRLGELLGSVSRDVIRHADRPVVVVRERR